MSNASRLFCLAISALMILFIVGYQVKWSYHNSWAYYNYGQTINGVTGTSGVDINYKKASHLLKKEDANAVRVAIVDTGIYNKSDAKYYNNLYEGWDYYNEDKTIYDSYSFDYHGTYIANAIYDLCKSVEIVPIKFMSKTQGNIVDCEKSINYAIISGARIVNCSWCFVEESRKIEDLIKSNPEVLFVVAAGNKGMDLDKEKLYPCCYDYDNVITVGAMNASGGMTEITGFGKHVTIFAPGDNIKVTLPENDTDYIDGTSIAVAFVTGACSDLLSVNPSLTAKEIKEMIEKSASKESKLRGKCCSGGYLDLYAAMLLMEEDR